MWTSEDNLESNSKRLLIVAGCLIPYTPVVKGYIKYIRESGWEVDVVEYTNFSRVQFIIDALVKIFKNGYSKIICVNNQSLPIVLVLSWISKKKLVYWKLESDKPFENWSIALKLQLLEWLLKRKAVSLVVPTTQRSQIQTPVFNNIFIVPNAPVKPYFTGQRDLYCERINLVLYGNMNKEDDIFLNEWIKYCKAKANIVLTIIGKEGKNEDRISWLPKIPHEQLIIELCKQDRFHFSIVGYRPINLNQLYSAPNRLIEGLACSLPIIGHIDNPYIFDLIRDYNCGLLCDFNKLNELVIDIDQERYSELVRGSINASKDLCLTNRLKNTPLWIDCQL